MACLDPWLPRRGFERAATSGGRRRQHRLFCGSIFSGQGAAKIQLLHFGESRPAPPTAREPCRKFATRSFFPASCHTQRRAQQTPHWGEPSARLIGDNPRRGVVTPLYSACFFDVDHVVVEESSEQPVVDLLIPFDIFAAVKINLVALRDEILALHQLL